MHHSMCFWCVLVLCAAVTAEVDFSTLKSPCPEMFSYKQSNGQWLGSLQLDRNMQNERQAEVKVGLSIPASLNGVRKRIIDIFCRFNKKSLYG